MATAGNTFFKIPEVFRKRVLKLDHDAYGRQHGTGCCTDPAQLIAGSTIQKNIISILVFLTDDVIGLFCLKVIGILNIDVGHQRPAIKKETLVNSQVELMKWFQS